MMTDVSVLLNLTGKLVVERTNPLMDLVSGHGPFLFYDQLSLERFPLAQEQQEEHVRRLLIDLCNLLGCRRLSADDKGGNIRLIIALDLVGGFSHQPGQTVWLPAQKVRKFMEIVNSVFEKETQLLSRLRYTFIFMEWDTDDSKRADFYRSLAYDGCYGHPELWLSSGMLRVNEVRDKMLASLNSSDDVPLDSMGVCTHYEHFLKELDNQILQVATVLSQAGLDKAFENGVRAGIKRLGTIGKLRTFDFDELCSSVVSHLAGLHYIPFDNCTFFVFKMRTDTITHRKKDEMVFFSFLQLLATMSTPWPAKFAIVDAGMNEHSMNVGAIVRLKYAVSLILPILRSDGNLKWSPTKTVSYSVYSANDVKTEDSNEYYKQNADIDSDWNQLYSEFTCLRQVPFFFGNVPGDWGWYSKVMANLDKISAFNVEHERPLYASSGRITDKEMKPIQKEASYTDLELEEKRLEAEKVSVNLLADLREYLKSREKPLAIFEEQKEELKKKMIRLGFASTTYWMGLAACVVITLCYALHFVYTGDLAASIWTGGCFGGAALVCCLASLIAQYGIKSDINDVFALIDDSLVKVSNLKQTYLKSIKTRVNMQNKSDLRRKNLDELKEKLNKFKNHNMQVGLWEKHFVAMETKLSDMLCYVDESPSARERIDFRIDADDLDIDQIPSLPDCIGDQFRQMKVAINQIQTLENVTCFLNRLNITYSSN